MQEPSPSRILEEEMKAYLSTFCEEALACLGNLWWWMWRIGLIAVLVAVTILAVKTWKRKREPNKSEK